MSSSHWPTKKNLPGDWPQSAQYPPPLKTRDSRCIFMEGGGTAPTAEVCDDTAPTQFQWRSSPNHPWVAQPLSHMKEGPPKHRFAKTPNQHSFNKKQFAQTPEDRFQRWETWRDTSRFANLRNCQPSGCWRNQICCVPKKTPQKKKLKWRTWGTQNHPKTYTMALYGPTGPVSLRVTPTNEWIPEVVKMLEIRSANGPMDGPYIWIRTKA